MEESTFLSPEEVAEMSDIRTGRTVGGRKVTREELQIEWLRTAGIPFVVSARGRPVIVRANVIGARQAAAAQQAAPAWQPRVIRNT
ncbi:DUF4224 domain-containing protein [Achromobacter veterisilvae]|uniref:DUF4224 domain-containing protein n=1 Tax=Achromobacter veterisilvae TaxID=2069367 RepID=A0ABZ2S8R9_9BURK